MPKTTGRIVLMGYLLSALASCGSRKSDGSPNASGLVYLYQAGTVQQEFGYSDAGCTTPITAPIVLDGAGKRTIYMKAPADVVVTDSSGTPVDSISAFNQHRAELVQVEHPSYTGALTDPGTGAVSQALGGLTSLQTILQSAALSLGPNFQYQLPGGTARNIQDWMKNVGVFAGDFGAKFDGRTDDTVAIQAAINFVASLGGGVVLLPPGTALIGTGGSGLTINHNGVALRGAGGAITTLKNASGTVDAITVTTGLLNIALRGFNIAASSTSTGAGIKATSTTGFTIEDVIVNSHDTSLLMSSCSSVYIGSNCTFTGNVSNAGSRAVKATNVSQMVIVGGQYAGDEYDVELLGTTNRISLFGAVLQGTSAGVRFDAALSGDTFAFNGCTFLGTLSFSVGAATLPLKFHQAGNAVEGSALATTTGNAVTPDLTKGKVITITVGVSGAGTVTVNNPTILPNTTDRDVEFTIVYINAAGSAVTWAFGTAYKHSAVPAATDGHTIIKKYLWDTASSKLRETSSVDIAT